MIIHPSRHAMLVSCITVTQPGREALLQLAISDFLRQTHSRRELLIIHDGGAAFDARLRAMAAVDARVRVAGTPERRTLGALRNFAVERARGELVCQWDDDDRFHPLRLESQLAALESAGSDVCFLSDQLHWFADTRELAWDDWHTEAYPMNFVQGTLLARRDRLPRYPELPRGEDTGLVYALFEAGRSITRLRGVGWCYVYVCHGRNAFDHAHHAAISRMKAMSAARVLAAERVLRERIAGYEPPIGPATLFYKGGKIELP